VFIGDLLIRGEPQLEKKWLKKGSRNPRKNKGPEIGMSSQFNLRNEERME
jgi:hypothetical protein